MSSSFCSFRERAICKLCHSRSLSPRSTIKRQEFWISKQIIRISLKLIRKDHFSYLQPILPYKMASHMKSLIIFFALTTIQIHTVCSLPISLPSDKDIRVGVTGNDKSPETLIHSHSNLFGLPEADGNLHIYALPVGNGDASVIQCPLGDVIILDMGQMSDVGWQPSQVKYFLSGHLQHITTIVISHPTESHYMILTELITDYSQVPQLRRIILAGQYYDYDRYEMIQWMNKFQPLIHFVNGGFPCVSDCYIEPPSCEGSNHTVSFKILAANLGEYRQGRSITMHIKTEKPNFQLFWQGDVRGVDIEDQIVKEWSMLGYSLNSTHMKIGNRASKYDESNTETLLNAVTPQFAFSSNPYPGRWNLKPDCRTIFRVVGILSVGKRSRSGNFACQNYNTFQVDQFENWCYNVFTTAPSPSDNSVVAIDVDLSKK
nr:Hexaxilin-8 [Euplectella curvistellata]